MGESKDISHIDAKYRRENQEHIAEIGTVKFSGNITIVKFKIVDYIWVQVLMGWYGVAVMVKVY